MTKGMFMEGQTLKNSRGKVTLFLHMLCNDNREIFKFYNVHRQDGGFTSNN